MINRNGVLLALAYVVVGLVWQVALYSAFIALLAQSDVPMDQLAFPSVDAPFAVLTGVALLSLILLQYLTIVAIRTFVGGHSHSIPSEYYRRNIGIVFINSILGGIVYGLLVIVGSIFLFIPGIIAYVAFLFVLIYIPVEDENFIAAFRDSWALTRGNWIRLFALVVILIVAIGLVSGILSAVTQLVISAVVGQAVGIIVSGTLTIPFSLLTIGILAEAFTQLRADHDDSHQQSGADPF